MATECSGHASRPCCLYCCTPSCHVVPQFIWSTSAAQSGPKQLGALYEAEGQSMGGTEHGRNYSSVCSSAAPAAPSQPCWADRERKSTPAPLATWVLIAFSCRDTKYLCKQCVQIVTCKRTCDTFMKYAKYDVLGYGLICVCIWKPFPCFGLGTEHFWQFVWGKQSQSVSMIHY